MRRYLVVFLLSAAALWAQQPQGPIKPPPGTLPQPVPEQRPIRVKVELVSTPVTAQTADGELVLDLTQRDFRVYDNGVEQRIENFELGGDPLSVVLVFETSSRVAPFLPAVRKSGILFAQTVLGQTGEAAVLGFDDHVEQLLPFTASHEQIEKTVENLRTGTSGVRLYSALSRAIGLLRNRPAERRRVILAVTEAADTGSETPLGVVLREAQLNNITVYTVGLSTTAAMLRAEPRQADPSPFPPGTFPRPPIPGTVQTPTTEQQRRGQIDLLAAIALLVKSAANAVGENALEMVTAGTGGLHIATFRDRSIEKAIDRIGGELHAQYLLTYRPAGTDPSGYHEIKVEVMRPGVRVRARPGYYTGPPEK